MKRKALFVGIDNYVDSHISNLNCCVQDASALYGLFQAVGFEAKLLANPTEAQVKREIDSFTRDLGSGDSFVFYFAGHGFTRRSSGEQLLAFSDSLLDDFELDASGIKFNYFNQKTAKGGFNRAFILDACRSDIHHGVRGGTLARDLVPIGNLAPKHIGAGASYFVLRSCMEGQYAHEIEGEGHGLFTLALIDIINKTRIAGLRMAFDDDFRKSITCKMVDFAKKFHIKTPQTPESTLTGLDGLTILDGKTNEQDGAQSNTIGDQDNTNKVSRPVSPIKRICKFFAYLTLISALAGGGYYGWMKYGKNLKANGVAQTDLAWFQKAAEQGNADVQFILAGDTLGSIAYEPKALSPLAADQESVMPINDHVTIALDWWIDSENSYWRYFRLRIGSPGIITLPVMPKDVVFIVDTSGSIGKTRLESCAKEIGNAIKKLHSSDRFNIISFRSECQYAFSGWQANTQAARDDVNRWLKNLACYGRTDIFAGLNSIISLPVDSQRPQIAVVLSDYDFISDNDLKRLGEDILRFSELNGNRFSVYAYGIKERSNDYLMRLLCDSNRGCWRRSSTSVQFRCADGLPSFTSLFADPILRDFEIDFNALGGVQAYPTLIQNLCAGKTIEIWGRCPTSRTELEFSLRGVNGTTVYHGVFKCGFDVMSRLGAEAKKEWARRRINELVGKYVQLEDKNQYKAKLLYEMFTIADDAGLDIPYKMQLTKEIYEGEECYVYMVRPGDSCHRIMWRFNTQMGDLARLNPGIKLDRLRVNQKIRIPVIKPKVE